MKLLEIHKNGINAHNNEVSFYGIDFQTKTLMFDGIENVECANNDIPKNERNKKIILTAGGKPRHKPRAL